MRITASVTALAGNRISRRLSGSVCIWFVNRRWAGDATNEWSKKAFACFREICHETTVNKLRHIAVSEPCPTGSPERRIWLKLFGRFGILWATGFTAAATVLRWALDGWLTDAAPFSFYYLSVVLAALAGRLGCGILGVVMGAICGHYLWVEPRLSFQFTAASQYAQLGVFVFVGLLNAVAVATARTFRIFEDLNRFDH